MFLRNSSYPEPTRSCNDLGLRIDVVVEVGWREQEVAADALHLRIIFQSRNNPSWKHDATMEGPKLLYDDATPGHPSAQATDQALSATP
jgi:hypothetical protein